MSFKKGKRKKKQPLTTTLVLAVTIAVGIQDRPAAAPQTGHWESDYQLFKNPSFTEAITAVSSLIFAYAGTPAFFSIVAEMRDPRLYNRSLAACQTGVTAFYITIGVVVYYFCGSYVASPALGSAGVLMKKVCYGLALPGLLATTTIVIHVSPNRLINIALPHPSKSLLTRETKATRQVHLHPHPPRLPPPHGKHICPLGHLAGLHHQHNHHRLSHRQRHPRLWRPRIPHRRAARHAHVLPALRVHVALR